MTGSAVVKTQSIETSVGTFTVRLILDDLGAIYPGMLRYTVEVLHGTESVYTYAINSYEVARPGSPFDTRRLADIVFARLLHDVTSRPGPYTRPRVFTRPLPGAAPADVIIIQASPRPFGNSAKIASWCDDEATRAGLSSRVLYLQDMDIRPCIGCYACYDYGYCPVDDDMPLIIRALEAASLLVICTPVYTSTVPAVLKAVMDRCQWLHARAGGGSACAGPARRGRGVTGGGAVCLRNTRGRCVHGEPGHSPGHRPGADRRPRPDTGHRADRRAGRQSTLGFTHITHSSRRRIIYPGFPTDDAW